MRLTPKSSMNTPVTTSTYALLQKPMEAALVSEGAGGGAGHEVVHGVGRRASRPGRAGG